MKFGPVPVAEAAGHTLAHSEALPSGRLRKGTILSPANLASLEAAGLTEVVVARLEPGDVAEDDAAARLARAMLPEPEASGLRIGKAATGRVNLHATQIGLVEVDAARIDAIDRKSVV